MYILKDGNEIMLTFVFGFFFVGSKCLFLTWFLGLSVCLKSGHGNKLSSPVKHYIQSLLKVERNLEI